MGQYANMQKRENPSVPGEGVLQLGACPKCAYLYNLDFFLNEVLSVEPSSAIKGLLLMHILAYLNSFNCYILLRVKRFSNAHLLVIIVIASGYRMYYSWDNRKS